MTRIEVKLGLVFITLLSPSVQAQTAVDGNGNVYVAAQGGAVVSKRSGGAEVYQINLGTGAKDAVLALALGPDHGLYVAGALARGGFAAKLNGSGERTAYLQLDATARAITVDAAGSVYIAGDGYLSKLDAKFKPVYQTIPPGPVAAIAAAASGVVFAAVNESVYRLSPDGKTWSNGLSLGRGTSPLAIATDAYGAAYATGTTSSLDFPVIRGALERLNGPSDAFAAKINPDGSGLEWSTYLGGLGYDTGTAIAMDEQGNITVAGYTTSPDLPETGSGEAWNGGEDGFIMQMDPQGRIMKSTYLGTAGQDRVEALALDALGHAHVAGWSDQAGRREWTVKRSAPAFATASIAPRHAGIALTVPFPSTGATAGVLLADGTVDPAYKIVTRTDGAAGTSAYVTLIAPGWVANSSGSKWIAPLLNEAPGNPAANYTYRVTLDLTGYNPFTTTVAGTWAADDNGVIRLNGVATSNTTPTNGWPQMVPFTLTGFQAGVNTIDFLVPNTIGGAGLKVEVTSATSTLAGSITLGSAGGSSSVVLTATGPWTATANDSFLHVSAGSTSGTGSALVVFTVDPFSGTGTRNGTLTVAGFPLTVVQVGTNYAAVSPVTTLVSSGLNHPYSAQRDASGNIYIADASSATIKKWSATTQQVTTLVTAGLNFPTDVAVDGFGDVYIADSGNNAIKKWSASTRLVTTLVSSGLNQPVGVAVDGSGNIYIGDYGNNAIKKWNASTQQVTTLVPSGLNNPQGVALDTSGNVYIADGGNNAVKKWSVTTQQLTTLVGSGLNTPTRIAVDGGGDVYIADLSNNAIKKWNAATQQVTTLVSSGLNGPFGLAVDGSGNVYFADGGNNAIKKINIAYESFGVPALTVGSAAGSNSVQVSFLPPDSTAPWTASTATSWLHITAGSTSGAGGAVIQFTYEANPNAAARTGTIALDSGLALTVTQAGTNYVAVSPVTTLVSTGLSFPDAVAVDGTGNVYIADYNNNAIRKWSAATQSVTTLVESGLSKPTGVGVDGAGNIYIADFNNNAIKKWSAATQLVTTLVSAGLNYPAGVAVDGSGNVYIADSGNSAIKKWSAATQQVTTLVSSGLFSPDAVAVDGTGNIYIADTNNNAIKKWNSATQLVTTLVATGLASPIGVAVDGSGNVYIADAFNHAIKKWSAATQQVTTQGTGPITPYGVAVDGLGNVYIADTNTNSIMKTTYAFVVPAGLNEPASAGSDALLPVLPATTPLSGVFAPASDQPWLMIGAVANGVVNFSFTANTGAARTGHITVLGQSIAVTQADATYAISGQVTQGGVGRAGVTVTLTGGPGGTRTTDSLGNFLWFNLPAGVNYTVTPSLTNYNFTPASATFNNLQANQFASFTVVTYAISGKVTLGGGGLAGVTLTLTGGPGGTQTSDSSGNYLFTILPAGGSYTVTPTRTNYTFTPGNVPINNLTSNVIANFSASISIGKPDRVGTTYSGFSVLDVNGNFAWDGPATDKIISWSTFQTSEKPIYGDWNGDGKTKVGVYNNGTWLLDYNGNGVWDGPTVDKAIYWSTGQSTDVPVMGDWNGDGRTKIGIYNNGTWILDYNGNGVWEGPGIDKTIYWSTAQAGEVPVVGDWNGDGKAKIGIHANGTWILDYNGNYVWDGTGVDKLIYFGGPGYRPMVGDWNGSGWAKIGAYNVNGTWALDYNGNFVWDGTAIDRLTFFGGPEWTPVVGDWSGSGTTKIGAYTGGQWALDYNGNFGWDVPPDRLFSFGAAGQTPIVGKW